MTTAGRSPVPPFSGAVLCGGASRRMGRDKALIVVEGRTLAGRVADALRAAGASDVVAVGGDLERLRAEGLPAVPDVVPGAGPLAGVITALAHHADVAGDGDIVVVVGCDLVEPSADAITTTVRALAAAPTGDLAVPLVDGRRQWMHAAWRRRAAMPLDAAFAAGERAVHAAVSAGGLRAVEVALDARSVADADVPSALPAGAVPDRPLGPGGRDQTARPLGGRRARPSG